MEIIYWNIGKDVGPEKFKHKILENLLNEIKPNVLCIAEGTRSKDDCENLILTITSLGYTLYYSPTFTSDPKYNLKYPYKPEGLKIFIKNTSDLYVPFTFDLQKENGRIVAAHTLLNEKIVTLLFVHNYSKNGDKMVTSDQISFISNLSEWIHLKGGIVKKSDKHSIIGDFNLEPWDYILRRDHNKSINSYFFTKHFEQEKKRRLHKSQGREFYFNPLLEHLIPNNETNLGGTYYSSSYGWALYDYAISSKNCSTNIKVITQTKSYIFVDSAKEQASNFLKHGFDHLPIQITIS
ncbi:MULTISPECIES: endonuclease/exonuclease/phosphatase family protein [Chryseobacterium]|uniref:endonuclease/exonuclease/phosphatase family protein n=2 Tax=Flavobacteriales TaxID=200644 RepID=UPI001FD66C19|nr:endonuclease/exonuclease/phosphatase family protein [Chryseobacterium daecheongense]UOU98246.1 endonuclease/exonuclease/phosphatase family protein [Chryseobacterium daecheongense]